MRKHTIQSLLLVQSLIVSLVACSVVDNGHYMLGLLLLLSIIITVVVVGLMPRTTYD